MAASASRVSPSVLRLAASAVVGVGGGTAVGLWSTPPLAVLTAVSAMSLVYVVSAVIALWPMDSTQVRAHATTEYAGLVVEEVVIALVALGSLAAIGSVLVLSHSRHRDLAAALAVLAVFATWAMLHTTYATRYARVYYDSEVGGITFHSLEQPRYADFLYFSFNLGMTYQVSDNDLSTTELRAIVLRHCLLSYVFGTVILAATINLVAGVALTH